MKSRGLVVAIAVVLAVLAAVGVIVYTSNVRQTAVDENTTPVLASTQDIQANTALDPLIAQGVFQTIQVSDTGVVPNAVTDVAQLQGQTATAPIYQNEQIPLDRISSGGGSNIFGIDPGNIGLGLEVQGQAAVNGFVQQGDYVTIYATFEQGTIVVPKNFRFLPAQLQQAIAGGGSGSASAFIVPKDFTIPLVPAVEVLAVQNPPVDTSTGRSSQGASSYILNMTPEDAQELVFATGHSTLYLGLLPPDNQQGYAQPGTIGVPLGKVVGVNK
jgi:Flp pilus assembly protein CpaB